MLTAKLPHADELERWIKTAEQHLHLKSTNLHFSQRTEKVRRNFRHHIP